MCAGPVYGARRTPLIPGDRRGAAAPHPDTALRTYEALREDELATGETYDSWLCASCGSVLPIARRASGHESFDPPDTVINIICLDCEAVRLYRRGEARARRYPWAT